jgi:phosphatidylglycerophosphatase A
MKKAAAFALATWFGCGLSPVAPGTVGTIAALPVYFALRGRGPAALVAASLAIAAVGVWSAGVVADHTGSEDPQIVVIDEVAGVLLALAVAPFGLAGVAAAVVLFRLFDVTKPWPARAAERLPRGWGVVLDDLAAGAWAAAGVYLLELAGALA